jgi:CRISPR type IV-associated protein Csf3
MLSEWLKQFKDGHRVLEDDLRHGTPANSRNADRTANVCEMALSGKAKNTSRYVTASHAHTVQLKVQGQLINR